VAKIIWVPLIDVYLRVLAVELTSQLELVYPLRKVQLVGRLEAKLTSAGNVKTEIM